jgi:hypothetical protein
MSEHRSQVFKTIEEKAGRVHVHVSCPQLCFNSRLWLMTRTLLTHSDHWIISRESHWRASLVGSLLWGLQNRCIEGAEWLIAFGYGDVL